MKSVETHASQPMTTAGVLDTYLSSIQVENRRSADDSHLAPPQPKDALRQHFDSNQWAAQERSVAGESWHVAGHAPMAVVYRCLGASGRRNHRWRIGCHLRPAAIAPMR